MRAGARRDDGAGRIAVQRRRAPKPANAILAIIQPLGGNTVSSGSVTVTVNYTGPDAGTRSTASTASRRRETSCPVSNPACR